jgi:hypothetical protein
MAMWRRIVVELHRPIDPSGLAGIRVIFAVTMMVEHLSNVGRLAHLFEEESAVGGPKFFFPLFNDMPRPNTSVLLLLEGVMYLMLLCIFVGLLYKQMVFLYSLCYWYLHILNTTSWTNHVSVLLNIIVSTS